MTNLKILEDEMVMMTRYIKELCGISLDASKHYLLETRLKALIEETGSRSFSELFFKARCDSSGVIPGKIIDAITTRETSFFRDGAPFEMIRDWIIPEIAKAREQRVSFRGNAGQQINSNGQSIRIWSAACSSGQEVYSLAILLREHFRYRNTMTVKLLGTDISDMAVKQAREGIFSASELARGMNADYRNRYFRRIGNKWQVKDEIKELTMFRKLNLLEDFSNIGLFDIVLCRNVAVYFSEEDRKNLFRRMAGVLEKGGFLIVGSTETLGAIGDLYKPHRHSGAVCYSRIPASSGQGLLRQPATP